MGPVDDRIMWDIWASIYGMPSLTAADALGLFACLEEGPKSQQQLCQLLALEKRPLEVLAGYLCAAGFLDREAESYALTPVARTYLLPASPYYWGGFFRQIRDWPVTHDAMLKALRQNQPTVTEEEVFALTGDSTDLAARFTRAMHAVTLGPAEAAAKCPDFEGVEHLLDVGGGSGNFSIALASAWPRIKCTVLELPSVCPIVAEYVSGKDFNDRVKTHACDFFADPWPAGQDAVLFGNIFHNWGHEQCMNLAQKAYASLPTGGQIFLHEMLLDDTGNGPPTVAANSLVMMFNHHGRQRSAKELSQLLQKAGFAATKVRSTFGYFSLVRARKP